MNELEILGQKTVELINLNREYDSLLSLVARLKSGEVSLANVHVDLEQRRWAIAPQNADRGAITGALEEEVFMRKHGMEKMTPAARAVMQATNGKDHHEDREEGV